MKRPEHGARPWRAIAVTFALVFALGTGTRPAAGQEGTPSPPPPDSTESEEPRSLEPEPAPAEPGGTRPPLGGTPAFTWGDSTGLVLPPLAEVRVRQDLALDLEASRNLRSAVEGRMLKARERSLRWKAQVGIQKSRIQALDRQIDAAKKEKRETDRKGFEGEKRREEKIRDFYAAMEDALEAEAEFHKATIDYARARIAAAELEQRLGERWGSGGYDNRVAAESRDLERRVLVAVKERGDRMATHAAREKTLADRRLDALKAWGEVRR